VDFHRFLLFLCQSIRSAKENFCNSAQWTRKALPIDGKGRKWYNFLKSAVLYFLDKKGSTQRQKPSAGRLQLLPLARMVSDATLTDCHAGASVANVRGQRCPKRQKIKKEEGFPNEEDHRYHAGCLLPAVSGCLRRQGSRLQAGHGC
jgi:hypothetical protein